MVNRSGMYGHSCLASDLKRKHPIFHGQGWFGCGLFVYALYQIEEVYFLQAF